MTDRELMQMALDALEKISMGGDPRWANDVTPALRARLAQPEPLPAKSKGALSHEENKQHNKKILDKFYEENAHLYTAPPQRKWQGLTAKDLAEIPPSCYEGAIWADAKLKEKNT